MQHLFINIYKFYSRKKYLFIATLLIIAAIITYTIYNIDLQEDIKSIIPKDKRIDDISLVLNNSKFTDQIIIRFSIKDSNLVEPELLISSATGFVETIEKDSSRIKSIRFKIEDNSFQEIYNFFYEYLPFYLSDEDYENLRNKFSTVEIEKTLAKNFKTLISPAGIATKEFIFKDPFSITPLALKKLQDFQLDENFTLYQSCIFTKDKKNLLVFVEPKYPSSETEVNRELIDSIESAINQTITIHTGLSAEYYGGTAVAVANANRIKSDISLTVSIAFTFIFVIFFFFFRNIKVLLLLFLPVIIGAGLAITVMTMISGSISAIALGIGAILLGISIDYSLHAFTHFRSNGSVTQTLKDINLPIIMSSLTTSFAFLCLFIINSEALNQLGMFGAFSVFFAAVSVLVLLPVFLGSKGFNISKSKARFTVLDKIAAYNIHKSKIIITIIIILSIVFSFTFSNITFNSDIATMNYLPEHLARAETNLQKISTETYTSVYLVTTGKTLNEALDKYENNSALINKAKNKNLYKSLLSVSDLLPSQKKQEEKIIKWENFWNSIDKVKLEQTIKEKGKELKFKENAFESFYFMINRKFEPISPKSFSLLQNRFLNNYINTSDSLISVINILKVDKENKDSLFRLFENHKDIIIFNKQHFSNRFFEIIREDFDKLVILSMLIVFGVLLISFGRPGLALITFIPILISWLWTLGLMGLFHIEFNIFNIIISTFIFGLGIDYAIFIMRGLINNHKYGNHPLTPYKLSVLLSVITTILGIGVLILAKHPALKSIAIVSIFGVGSIVLISYTFLPMIFGIMTTKRDNTRREPLTLKNSIISAISFSYFVLSSTIVTIFIPIFYILPIQKKHSKYAFNYLVHMVSKIIVYLNFHTKKEIINKDKLDFKKPAVIVSNHQSHLDIAILLALHPKIIVLTNKWVWHSPFFGFIIRFADYYPIYQGIEKGFDKIRKKVSEGYSVVVFPEGTRTPDGTIKRFHQGAFKLADDLGIDIQPLLIHGAYHCMSKSEFFIRSGHITIKFFDRLKVSPVNIENNETYRPQAKALNQFLRKEFALEILKKETPDYFRQHVINQYILKDPVLEWYVKVKLRVEKNYNFINNIIPRQAKILDIGCGYGCLAYLLRCISKERDVTGIDFDEEKIAIANNIVKNDDGIRFIVQDITQNEVEEADVFILNDVLHYMPENLQEEVLNKCIQQLSENGIIIITEADKDLKHRTRISKLLEAFSTKIIKFNKTNYKLNYISGKKIIEIAKIKGLKCEIFDNSKRTSDITYVIRK